MEELNQVFHQTSAKPVAQKPIAPAVAMLTAYILSCNALVRMKFPFIHKVPVRNLPKGVRHLCACLVLKMPWESIKYRVAIH